MDANQILAILEKANQIASTTSLDRLLNQMLDLIMHSAQAKAGTLYLLDKQADELIFKVVRGGKESQNLINKRISASSGIVGASINEKRVIYIKDVSQDIRWLRDVKGLENALTIPMVLENHVLGAVQIFNFSVHEIKVLSLLTNRIATEVEKIILIEEMKQKSNQLMALIDIFGQISSTLDENKLLRMIIDHSSKLLNAETCSLFLLDEETNEIVMHVSSQLDEKSEGVLRVPMGKGIIGTVINSGEYLIVNDAKSDPRHYAYIDSVSGLHTQSILAVPLRTQRISFTGETEIKQQTIIGGLEAINSAKGIFTKDDAILFQTLANQAATFIRIAQAYRELNTLFMEVIQSLTTAIDAKDPYTRGHSQRVSDFSVAIGKQLRLDPAFIRQISIGSILHDIGKIGIADHILNKTGRLTNEEFAQIQEHPYIGERILRHVKLLREALSALSEHHERLDGSGYPSNLVGEQISLLGRIVAVADVFDAMTSDRTYRNALSVEETFRQLDYGLGTHFDPIVVQALHRAYRCGEIKTQKERFS